MPPPEPSPRGPRPAEAPLHRSRLAPRTVLLAYAPAYLAAVALGHAFFFDADNVSAFWPASGVAIAALVLVPYRLWPHLLALSVAAEVVAEWTFSAEHLPAWGLGDAANLVEVTLGAYLWRRIAGPDRVYLSTFRGAVGVTLGTLLLAPAVGAALGAWSFSHARPAASFGETFQVWWLADVLGIMVVLPTLLSLLVRQHPEAPGRGAGGPVEQAIYWAGLTVVSHVVLGAELDALRSLADLQFVVFPFLMWAALRFDLRVVAGTTTLVSLVAIWHAVRGDGPFQLVRVESQSVLVLGLQAFLITIVVSALWLKAALTSREIVERRRRESERKALEAERRSAAARAAAAAAHDFNNQLAVALAHLDLHSAGDPAEVAVGGAREALLRARDLARSLQELSHERAARADRCDVAATVRAHEPALRALLAPVQLVLGALPAATVRVGEADLGRVLVNLATNARDALGGRGHLWVHGERHEDAVVLVVEDDGPGMSAPVRARAFEPFYSTKGEHGTGLGLASVHALVARSGGTVQLDSSEGEGTRFTLTLPLAPPA